VKQTREQLVASGHFVALRERNCRFITQAHASLDAGEIRNFQFTYGELLRRCLGNGCITLILGEGDGDVLKAFHATVEYALKLIGASPPPGGGLRAYNVDVEISEEGARVKDVQEREPMPGEEKLSITDYYRALICTACFGDRSQITALASVPEDAYRNPGSVASADYWAYVRAWKAFLLGRDAEARRGAEFAFSKGAGSGKAEAGALLAVMDLDQRRFTKDLQGALKLYMKTTSKQVNDPITSVFFPGLMLCRQAIARGIKVEDGPYLPVRLLPGYTAVVN
jgi:hypothetical protein